MPAALDRVFAEVADYSRTMGGLHHNFLDLVKRDVDRFLEKSKNLSDQMFWQGCAILGLSTISASLAIAGELVPKSGPAAANTPTLDRRLNTNDGITDGFSNAMKAISQKLSDNDFLRTTCKTASHFFGEGGLSRVVQTGFQSTTTKIEAAKSLLMSCNISDGQGKKSMFDQQVNQAHQAALRLLESKSKGG
ncbi:MAG: hypothetical protein WA347_09000 [Rhabdochlamydiaceae bacterium]|jgi:hypothetical protein